MLGAGPRAALPRQLSIPPRLATPSFTPGVAGSIALARLPTPPAPSRLLTAFAAIACLRMPRPEQPFASFEQTTPGPMMTALWPRAEAPKKITSVHGSWLLPMFKSRSEALNSLRGVFYTSPFIQEYFTSRVSAANHGARRGPVHRALLSRFQSATDTFWQVTQKAKHSQPKPHNGSELPLRMLASRRCKSPCGWWAHA
jgi:hypothetical protein